MEPLQYNDNKHQLMQREEESIWCITPALIPLVLIVCIYVSVSFLTRVGFCKTRLNHTSLFCWGSHQGDISMYMLWIPSA